MPEVQVLREIDPRARIAPDVRIGAYCVIGPRVVIGPGTVVERRVMITSDTRIGSGNRIEEGCILGEDPQDLKYRGSRTVLIIGDRNRLCREVTAHIGTEEGGYITRIGDDNLLMNSCHIAHDCYVDDHARLGRQVLLAGHVRVQTGAVIGDQAGLHHFTTIGRFAKVGAQTPVRRDVPPYTHFLSRFGDQVPTVHGVHEEGITSAGLSPEAERDLRRALQDLFYDEMALQTKIEHLVAMGVEGEVSALCEFCQRSLHGVYGRYREIFRGRTPPEAEDLLDDNGYPALLKEKS